MKAEDGGSDGARRTVGRYRLGGLIGRGGMGEVYRAWDPDLERWVAVKLLTSMTEQSRARFAREARAQIALEHPMVCPVYEVGEQEGRPYIVMQLIEGEPLLAAAEGMTLEEIVTVFIDVAETLHAAHVRGFIHRDVKPSNILVERIEGRWHPWLVDFGLVAARGQEELTRSGETVGTPVYMAPEQILGSAGRIDRRADVYALGATLYRTLTGTLPFGEGHPVEVMARVLAGDLQRPRDLVPSLPPDLEAVILKAMEPARERRYGSARELADDLRRFLGGDPVEARRSPFLWRVRRLVRRHPAAAAALTVLLAGGIAGGALALRANWRSRTLARLATMYGREAAAIEAGLRMAALEPRHDIRKQRETARRRLDAIERSMQEEGLLARGPGEVALGRGELALGRPREALAHLERAWKDGIQDPEVAWLLGRALSAVYRLELRRARAVAGREGFERLRPGIEQRYRDPALRYLRLAEGWDPDRTLYVESLIAFDEGRYDEALRLARAAAEAAPGFFEARALVGEILLERAQERFDRGEPEAAAQAVEAAIEELKRARVVARSGPGVHDVLCEAGSLRLRFATRRGTVDGRVLEEARDLCRDALEIDPGSTRALGAVAGLNRSWAMWQVDHGEDPSEAFAAAETAARAAVAVAPDRADHHAMLGKVLMEKATGGRLPDEKAGPLWEEALAELTRALQLEPGISSHWNNRGLARWRYSGWLRTHGGDWEAVEEGAVEDLRRAAELDPRSFQVWTNLGGLMLTRSFRKEGDAVLADLDAATEALERALALNPRSSVVLNILGAAKVSLAQAWLERGRDPGKPLEEGIGYLERSFEENPSNHRMYNNLATAYLLLASSRIEGRQDPGDAFAKGFELIDRALELNANDVTALINRAEGRWWRARGLLMAGRPASKELAEARASVRRARRLLGTDAPLRSITGRLALLEGRVAAAEGRDPLPALARAEEMGRKLLADDETRKAGLRLIAGAVLERARWQRRHGGPWMRTVSELLGDDSLGADMNEDPRLGLLVSRLELLAAHGEEDPDRRRALRRSARTRLERIAADAPLLATSCREVLAEERTAGEEE